MRELELEFTHCGENYRAVGSMVERDGESHMRVLIYQGPECVDIVCEQATVEQIVEWWKGDLPWLLPT